MILTVYLLAPCHFSLFVYPAAAVCEASCSRTGATKGQASLGATTSTLMRSGSSQYIA